MLTYPDIDPVALALGPLQIHWYGLMYLLGFAAAWGLGRWRAARPGSGWSGVMVDDLIFYGVIGVILGGRLGYMLFYGLDQVAADPLALLRVWEGGMSFHGGLLGVLIATALFSRRQGLTFFQATDFLAPLVPLGLLAGRIGNFINGELWGHRTNLPWGIQLPCEQFPRQCLDQPATTLLSPAVHASQLYEALLEGLVLFVVLWLFSSRPRPTMAVSGLFLVGYGAARFSVEFVRLPDAHLGYLAFGWLTMGQLLTLPMILAGALLLALAYRRPTGERA
ncbi:prolipoprotein diacylglyceryl transferase [Marichromatium gracile]|uniref:Phosphatidylglycerol--prolipoprotein diacylglyceryl transferase n=1 Tax=Marichromatium gracile TaxID=1048 RepID=A0A4R4AEU9_MARGR|nr:prolipoprotein diacylglyceryl transferase [Marichromatium gracile]MBK1710486.1 prolipoprotein diacylglyceryl transferase [Marichromatium gracile]TCW37166.1 phosphatidylglycerol:prolipoprotein diacylglycerol transferase [Marichromatium gracile]